MKKLFIIITILASTFAPASEKLRQAKEHRNFMRDMCSEQWCLHRLKKEHSNEKCAELFTQCLRKVYADVPAIRERLDDHIKAILPLMEKKISNTEKTTLTKEEKKQVIALLEVKLKNDALRRLGEIANKTKEPTNPFNE